MFGRSNVLDVESLCLNPTSSDYIGICHSSCAGPYATDRYGAAPRAGDVAFTAELADRTTTTITMTTTSTTTIVPVHCWSFIYLTTGVLVSVLGQRVASCPDVDPRLHVLPAAKWLSTLVVSVFAHAWDGNVSNRGKPSAHSVPSVLPESNARHVRLVTLLLGVLDCSAYLLFCMGFARCGAAATAVVLPAMGHVLTAVFSVTLLRNRLSERRWWAVGLVLVGVLGKGWDVDFGGDGYVREGFGWLALASLCYSSMGVIYEKVVRMGAPPRHATVTLWSSAIGAVGWMGYYALWLEEVGFTGSVGSWGVPLAWFVAVYNVHVYVQGRTFREDGALGVQLVNAVRGCVTNTVFWIIGAGVGSSGGFVGLLSGVVAGAGGLLWVERKPGAIAEEKKQK